MGFYKVLTQIRAREIMSEDNFDQLAWDLESLLEQLGGDDTSGDSVENTMREVNVDEREYVYVNLSAESADLNYLGGFESAGDLISFLEKDEEFEETEIECMSLLSEEIEIECKSVLSEVQWIDSVSDSEEEDKGIDVETVSVSVLVQYKQ